MYSPFCCLGVCAYVRERECVCGLLAFSGAPTLNTNTSVQKELWRNVFTKGNAAARHGRVDTVIRGSLCSSVAEEELEKCEVYFFFPLLFRQLC